MCRKLLGDILNQLIGVDITRADDVRDDPLAQVLVGHPDDGDLLDSRVPE